MPIFALFIFGLRMSNNLLVSAGISVLRTSNSIWVNVVHTQCRENIETNEHNGKKNKIVQTVQYCDHRQFQLVMSKKRKKMSQIPTSSNLPHLLQQSQSHLPLLTRWACQDCCTVRDAGRLYAALHHFLSSWYKWVWAGVSSFKLSAHVRWMHTLP